MKRIAIGLVMALAAGLLRAEGELPAGFTELTSIVAGHGTYIDTGYKPNQKSHVMMDVTVQGKAEYWFSVSGANYTTDAYALCNDDDLGVYYAVGNDGGSVKVLDKANNNEGCVPNGRHTVEITPYSFKLDGEVWLTKESQGDFQLSNNLYLFASNASVDHNAYVRVAQKSITCHGCKIYEGDELKHDFVPCANSRGRSGLYDRVAGKFLSLQLPTGYTIEEGLAATGAGEYVDTGYSPTTNTCIEAEFTALPRSGANGVLFGVSDGNETRDADGNVIEDPSSSVLLRYNGETGNLNGWFCNTNATEAVSADEFGGDPSVTTKVTLEAGRMVLNGDTYAITTTGTPVQASIYIFGCNQGGNVSNPQTLRLHSFNIYTDSTLMCEFVPCVNAKGRRGLYDVRGGRFHPLQLPAGYTELASIVAARGTYIDTGYKPNQKSHVAMDVTVQGKAEYWFSVSGADYTTDAYALCNDDRQGVYYAVGNDGGSVKVLDKANNNEGCVPNGRHTVEITPYSFKLDGEVWLAKVRKGDFQLLNNLYLFASNDSAHHNAYAPDAQTTITCHGCWIYDGETLVHSFVPCVDSCGWSGMYDLVAGEFLPLQLPTGYIAQDSIVVPRDDGNHIDTGYRPSSDTRVMMDVTVQGTEEYWFGCWDRNYNDGAFGFGNDGWGVYAGYGNQGGTFGSPVASGRHKVELDKNLVKVDGSLVCAFNAETFAWLNNSLYLFAENRNGTVCFAAAQRSVICHGCAISENGALQRSYVPCMYAGSGALGLYETATGKFYEYSDARTPGAAEAYNNYLANHDFGSETFVEFSRWQSDELLGFLQAARSARNGLSQATAKTDCMKVWIILRNPRSDEWVLNNQIVDAFRILAKPDDHNRTVSLVILANPDVFPTPQTYGNRSVNYAIRSFYAEGGPIVLTYQNNPLEFAYKGSGDVPSSLLYGLTFKDCTRSKGNGAAVYIDGGDRNCVRLVNCTFQNCTCPNGEGGAVYMNIGKQAASLSPIGYQFYPYAGSELLQADYDGVNGSHIYHCTFNGCSSKSNGGAVYGDRGKVNGVVITDCTFKNCKSEANDGGAVIYAKTAYRCTFDQCTANGSQGGGCYNVLNVFSCLFRECASKSGGGAVDREGGRNVRIIACTFDSCKSQNHNIALDTVYTSDSNPVCGCLLFNSLLPGAKVESWTDNLTQSDSALFVARPSDYHIRPDMTDRITLENPPSAGGWTTYEGPSIYADASECTMNYSTLQDRDGWPLVSQYYPLAAGCYRAYTAAQWEQEKERLRPYEWKTLNPLEVTIQEDIVNSKDGKISFREACLYLMEHQTAPLLVCEDQWPRITFALPAGSRSVTVKDTIELRDSARPVVFNGDLSGRQPVIIDGGEGGMTIHNEGGKDKLLALGVSGVCSNILFTAGTVSVEPNETPSTGKILVATPYTDEYGRTFPKYVVSTVVNDCTMRFDNCAFEGGTRNAWLARSDWGNVRFDGCTFYAPSGGSALGGIELNVVSNQVSQFACCTFAGLAGAAGVIVFRDYGGELRLVNCTFAGNDGVIADVLIGRMAGFGGVFRALNCIFADVSCANAYSVSGTGLTTIYCSVTNSLSSASVRKGELMMNAASDNPLDVLDSADRITRVVRGVLQYAFKPKHAFTARYGRQFFVFGDGIRVEQPSRDIFRNPQTGRCFSMGSLYVDDIESPSIDVTTDQDVTDPYDDVVSLREAIAYGAADDRFAKGLAVTPTFWGGEAGDVLMSVTGAIHVASEGAYRDFGLVIQPGENQALTISSATNSPNGVFAQDAGTRLQFRKVSFDGCGSVRGDGGVLTTAGTYRFDDCAFSGCWATGLREPNYGYVSETVDGLVQRLREGGYPDAFGLAAVKKVADAREIVAEAVRVISSAHGASRDLSELRQLAVTAAQQLKAVVDAACGVLAQAKKSLAGEVLVAPDDKRSALTDVLAAASNLQDELAASSSLDGLGLGGAIRAKKDANGILRNVSVSDGFALGAGGAVANDGRLVGFNLTFRRLFAQSGGAVHCAGGTNLFASVAFVDNVSATNGALHAGGGLCGIVNSLVVGNADSTGAVSDLTATDGATMNVQYTLDSADVTKADVFANGGDPVLVVTSNGVEQLCYPLDPMGKASGTGAYVFFKTEKGGQDITQAGWINDVFYSTDPDGFFPKALSLSGTKGSFNNYLSHDQLGNQIECWDWRNQLALPASMGPVPKMAAAGPSAVVTTTKDDVGAAAGVTTLRAAAAYAMSNGVAVTFADGLFAGGATPVFELSRQIDVPKGAALRIVAGSGRTVELRPSEAAKTNKFFTVFEGGSLVATGLRLEGGYAHVDSPYMQLQPANPNDGGAVQGFGPMAFTNCIFRANTAPGHGGAIWSCGGLTLSGCLFETNCAGVYGGAVYSDRERLDVSGTKFVDNVAQKGGAIYVNNSTNVVCLETTDIVRNVAREIGGGLYLGGDEIQLEQGLVVVEGTDVRIVGNTVGDEGKSDNVFVGEKVKFDLQTLNRPPVEYTKVAVVNGVASIVLDEEKAKPVLGDFDLGQTEFDSAAVSVENVVPGLLYGLGRAETPVGPYVVDKWVRAKPGEAVILTAPKEGASGFYRIMARE